MFARWTLSVGSIAGVIKESVSPLLALMQTAELFLLAVMTVIVTTTRFAKRVNVWMGAMLLGYLTTDSVIFSSVLNFHASMLNMMNKVQL